MSFRDYLDPGGGVRDLEPTDEAVLAVEADMVLVAEHRNGDLGCARARRSALPSFRVMGCWATHEWQE